MTRRLDVTPTVAFRRGDPFGRGGFRCHGQWELCTEGRVASNVLEEHIAWLLDLIEPVSVAFDRLTSEGLDTNVFCYLASRAQDDDASCASFGGKR
jgi:hypothetical protein